MANEEHLAILKRGVGVLNKWREDNPTIQLDLSGADLANANLSQARLEAANLSGTNLRCTNLVGANLRRANLTEAHIANADLSDVDLSDAQVVSASLLGANLRGATLTGTNFCMANLTGANLAETNLADADVTGAYLPGVYSSDDSGVIWAGVVTAVTLLEALLNVMMAAWGIEAPVTKVVLAAKLLVLGPFWLGQPSARIALTALSTVSIACSFSHLYAAAFMVDQTVPSLLFLLFLLEAVSLGLLVASRSLRGYLAANQLYGESSKLLQLTKQPAFRLTCLWVVGSGFGALAGAALALELFPTEQAYGLRLPPFYTYGVGLHAFAVGVPFAISQWLLLRYVPRYRENAELSFLFWWMPVTSIGIACMLLPLRTVAFAEIAAPFAGVSPSPVNLWQLDEEAILSVVGSMILVVRYERVVEVMLPGMMLLAVGQWFVLYRVIHASYIWTLLTIAGASIGAIVGLMAAVTLFPLALELAWAFVQGISIAVFQGIALVLNLDVDLRRRIEKYLLKVSRL